MIHTRWSRTMNGVRTIGAWPATTVLRLSSDRVAPETRNPGGNEVILAAVHHPPRIGEVRPIAALMPEVLARYGLVPTEPVSEQPRDSVSRAREPVSALRN